MTQATLVAAAAAASCAGAAYAYLAYRLHRDTQGRAVGRAPMRGFVLWWATLALNMLGVASTYVAAALGALPFEAQLVVSISQRILLGVGVAGLLYYLVFLRTGRSHARAITLAYATYILLALASMLVAQPNGVFIGEWRTELAYASAFPAWGRALGLLIVLPSIVASVAYFLLYFQVEHPLRRYRIGIVSWTLIGWWVLAVIAGQGPLLDVAWLQVLNRAASVATALLVLSAYHPPHWLARRLARSTASGTPAEVAIR